MLNYPALTFRAATSQLIILPNILRVRVLNVMGGVVKLQSVVNLKIKIDISWNWITELNPNFSTSNIPPLE